MTPNPNAHIKLLPGKFAATVAVWGGEYIRFFLDYTLPTLLTEGNFPALEAMGVFTLHLYVIPEEYEVYFKPNNVWQQFERNHKSSIISLVEVWRQVQKSSKEFTSIEKMLVAHNHFGQANDDGDTALIFLGSDVLYCENCHQFQVGKLTEGYRAVMLLGLRVSGVETLCDIGQYREDGNSAALKISSTQMASLFRKHIHVDYKVRFMGKSKVASRSSTYFWDDEHGNIVVRNFHHHPGLVWPEADFNYMAYPTTVDDYYTASVVHPHRICYPESARDIVILSPSADNAEGSNDCLINYPAPEQLGVTLTSRSMNIRVIHNILHHYIIPARFDDDLLERELRALVNKSFQDAQLILTAMQDTMTKLMGMSSFMVLPPRPGLREGIVDADKGTLLTYDWVGQNWPKALVLLKRQPWKFLSYICRHPKAFFSCGKLANK